MKNQNFGIGKVMNARGKAEKSLLFFLLKFRKGLILWDVKHVSIGLIIWDGESTN